MSRRVLVVEDSKPLACMIGERLESTLSLEVSLAHTYAEAVQLLDEAEEPFEMALLDLKLPDSMNGEILDMVLLHSIPTVVFTGTFSEEMRAVILSKNVVDYVLKENLHDVDYVVDLFRRVLRNPTMKILVVDDSRSTRRMMRDLLAIQKFTVMEAADGLEALRLLKENPDIKLVITDYIMPGMDGFELVSKIRRRYGKNKLAIIGISAQGTGALSAKFLKKGANDFITKPFLAEEFYCRVNQNIDYLEYVERIENFTYVDYLTSVWNRRYFFSAGEKFYLKLKQAKTDFCLAMIDLDHFKKVNDTYGHDCGDTVLKEAANLLKAHFGNDAIVARLGGEEFCVLWRRKKEEQLEQLEVFRASLAMAIFSHGTEYFSVTASIGATSDPCNNLAAMVSAADQLLYASKTGGRNRVNKSCRYTPASAGAELRMELEEPAELHWLREPKVFCDDRIDCL